VNTYAGSAGASGSASWSASKRGKHPHFAEARNLRQPATHILHHRTNQAERSLPLVALVFCAERLSSAAPRRGDCYPRKVPRSRGLLERPVRLRGLHEGAESTHTSPKARNPPPTLDPHSARPHGSSRAISARRGPGVLCAERPSSAAARLCGPSTAAAGSACVVCTLPQKIPASNCHRQQQTRYRLGCGGRGGSAA
jgi:hypothetical protein